MGATGAASPPPPSVSMFQSSPTPKDGRYFATPHNYQTHSIRFNPRPPRRMGATSHPARAREADVVSILAHPEGWALPFVPGATRTKSCVSILAHPEGWALHEREYAMEGLHRFQSSPTPKDGRYNEASKIRGLLSSRFNPRPPRRMGATMCTVTSSLPAALFQSSPTPKDGRYRYQPNVVHFDYSFNPRPPRRMGATRKKITLSTLSILFQSSPTPKDGRYSPIALTGTTSSAFQSSPTPKDGRYCRPVVGYRCADCFNPRPPRRMGATRYRRRLAGSICGFNPRPPRRMGATRNGNGYQAASRVSILAHPEGWALLVTAPRWRDGMRFQSSPTPKDGRYQVGHVVGGSPDVSILAHPEGWALRSRP